MIWSSRPPSSSRSGSAESIGPTLVSLAKSEIERQIRLLDLWLEVTSSATELNRRRDTVWDSANETLFETVFGSNFRARNPLGASYPRDSRSNRDDEQARSLLLEAAYALGSVDRFEDALRLSGVFHEESDAVEDADLMFEVRSHDVRVEFSHTDYGRFGIWSRTVGNSARDGIEFDPGQSFGGPSPIVRSNSRGTSAGTRASPPMGVVYYEGTTLAVDEGSGGPRFFEGQICLDGRLGCFARSRHGDLGHPRSPHAGWQSGVPIQRSRSGPDCVLRRA